MADLTPQEVATNAPQESKKLVKVTPENAAMLSVQLLSQIYGRLGYIIKLLEKK